MRDGTEKIQGFQSQTWEEQKWEKNKALQEGFAAAEETFESFGENRKRKEEESSSPTDKEKRRKTNGSETFSYLQAKHKDELNYVNNN